jgi:rhombotail lipoprotein
MKHFLRIVPIVAVVAMTGCAVFDRTAHHRTSSVMHYLYPRESERVDTPVVPVLSLPLKVGIAFVPNHNPTRRGSDLNFAEDSRFTEKQRMDLMKETAVHFKTLPFVQSIELIPSAYLRPEGSFDNLNQLRSMFGIDVIVLLSYDQVQFTDEGLISLSYWTVVGAYVVRGERNDTRTMVDAVVYDITSRKLLFRAPGVSQIRGSATPVNLEEQLRVDAGLGLRKAATNMVVNLDEQLALFKEKVRESPEEYNVVMKPGYKGAAAMGRLDLLVLGAMGTVFFCAGIRRN